MSTHLTTSRSVLLALALTLAAGPSLAATTVNVTEDGKTEDAMTLTLEPASVKAGEVTFMVKNADPTDEHEMVLMRLKSADQKLPFNAKKNRVDESQLKTLGEVEDIKPGASGMLTATLKPGTYMLFCNIKGHYKAGMHNTLTVTK
ncbi:cupredoxin domain-containing protein [Mesorhizobium sp. RP14(2022)]|uniref:Cupredoxin domain-containing protein n=1 Tax=Mesorhizobium liriopis TaxID=2953882 RepID=A0ABT1C3E7_9HYPH|nr:plastocyanin/azurin family copper-binding protein [Mesorhizobium liriopis]MCO6049312.1 cupredoxin domain-containing protein [Mesorhizobium liriopis]